MFELTARNIASDENDKDEITAHRATPRRNSYRRLPLSFFREKINMTVERNIESKTGSYPKEQQIYE